MNIKSTDIKTHEKIMAFFEGNNVFIETFFLFYLFLQSFRNYFMSIQIEIIPVLPTREFRFYRVKNVVGTQKLLFYDKKVMSIFSL